MGYPGALPTEGVSTEGESASAPRSSGASADDARRGRAAARSYVVGIADATAKSDGTAHSATDGLVGEQDRG